MRVLFIELKMFKYITRIQVGISELPSKTGTMDKIRLLGMKSNYYRFAKKCKMKRTSCEADYI